MIGNRVFIITAFCLSVTLAETFFRPCDEGHPAPLALRVKGCTTEPCLFYRGEDVEAEWDFAVVSDTDDLKPEVWATFAGMTTNYALPQQDACKSLTNGECPLDESEEVTYGLRMPILRLYPKFSLALKFMLVDGSGKVHVCFKLNAKITDK